MHIIIYDVEVTCREESEPATTTKTSSEYTIPHTILAPHRGYHGLVPLLLNQSECFHMQWLSLI